MNIKVDGNENMKWTRVVLNVVWLIILISFISEVAAIGLGWVLGADRKVLLLSSIYFLTIPSGVLILLTGLTEIIVRRFQRAAETVTVVLCSLVPSVIILVFDMVEGIQYIQFISILASTLYFSKPKVILSFILTSSFFLTTLLVSESLRAAMTPYSIILAMTILIGCTMLSFTLMTRGMELLDVVREKSKIEQKLLFENYQKDQMTRIDGLTQVGNRYALDKDFINLRTSSFCFALLDADHFKQINDTYGHLIGDKVLQQIARQTEKVIGSEGQLYRYGGEEFALILPNLTLLQAAAVAEQVRDAIERINLEEYGVQCVTVSIGVAEWLFGETKAELFERADKLLYRAKSMGRNQVIS